MKIQYLRYRPGCLAVQDKDACPRRTSKEESKAQESESTTATHIPSEHERALEVRPGGEAEEEEQSRHLWQ